MDSLLIPGYEILEPIGDGATSVVYKARQTSLNRVVAIKVLRPERIAEPAVLAQFKLEANATATLKHPNILQVYEAGEVNGVPFFVMEYVSGYSVESWINRKGRLAELDVLTLADTVCRALKYAWERAGLIHADLKPGNLLVDGDGLIKVADFSGLSRDTLGPESEVLREMTIGTPNYMSPEQVRGVPDLDFRADIYGLGCMLYHLLSGRIAFADQDPAGAMRKQVEDYLPDVSESVPAGVSLPTILLVERMMVKNRELRIASWDAVHAEVTAALQGRRSDDPVPPAGASTMRRTTPLVHRGAVRVSAERLKPLAPGPAGSVPPARRGFSRPLKWMILLTLALLLAALDYVLLFHPFPLHRRETDIRPLPQSVDTADLSEEIARPESGSSAPAPRPSDSMPESDTASPQNPLIPEEPMSGTEPREEPVRMDESDGQAVPPLADYNAYLDLMQDVLLLSRQHQWKSALDRLNAAETRLPDWTNTQKDRLKQLVGWMDSIATGGTVLRGMTIETAPGFSGEIVGIQDHEVRIQQTVGGGHAQTVMEIAALKPGDLLALLLKLDPTDFPLKEAMVDLGLCDFEAASGALRRAKAAGLKTAEAEAWMEDWRTLIQDVQARKALTDLQNLIVQSRFEEAAALAERIRTLLGEGRILRNYRTDDFEKMTDLLRREARATEMASSSAGPATPEEDLPADDPAAIRLFTVRELKDKLVAWDGRPVRLRFRARGEIERTSLRLYRTRLIGEDGEIPAVFDDDGLRWVRAVPLQSLKNRDVFVFGRVDAEHSQIVLLGRTRRLLIGHRGSEYAW